MKMRLRKAHSASLDRQLSAVYYSDVTDQISLFIDSNDNDGLIISNSTPMYQPLIVSSRSTSSPDRASPIRYEVLSMTRHY